MEAFKLQYVLHFSTMNETYIASERALNSTVNYSLSSQGLVPVKASFSGKTYFSRDYFDSWYPKE